MKRRLGDRYDARRLRKLNAFYQITPYIMRNRSDALDYYEDLFDGYHDETIYFNNPLQFVPNIDDEALLALLRRMEIHLAVGEFDPCLTSNCQLSDALQRLVVAHRMYVWQGRAHKPQSWRQMADLYL